MRRPVPWSTMTAASRTPGNWRMICAKEAERYSLNFVAVSELLSHGLICLTIWSKPSAVLLGSICW